MDELTREMEWFLDTLQKELGVIAEADAVAVEVTELGLEEVGVSFVPREVIDYLPETLLYELMIVDDEKGTEWIGAIYKIIYVKLTLITIK